MYNTQYTFARWLGYYVQGAFVREGLRKMLQKIRAVIGSDHIVDYRCYIHIHRLSERFDIAIVELAG